MPGICGIVHRQPLACDHGNVESMLLRMKHADWYCSESASDADAGVEMGRVSLGFVNTGAQPAKCNQTASMCVMDGEIYNANEIRASLHNFGDPPLADNQAELLLRGYLADGKAFLSRTDGKFSAAPKH